MASDGKITIDLEINDHGVKGALDDVASKARGIPDVKINVSADTKGALGDIAEAAKAAKGVSGGEVKITGNNADAKADISEAERLAKDVKGGTVEIKGNNSDAKADIAEAEELAKDVEGGTVTIKGNNDGALGAIDEVNTAARGVEDGATYIDGSNDDAMGAIDDVNTAAESVSDGETVLTGTDESATSTIDDVNDKADTVHDGNVSVTGSDESATSTINDVNDKADAVHDGKVSITGSDESATSTINDVSGKADALNGMTPNITITADGSQALSEISEVVAAAEAANGTEVTVGSSGSSDGSSGGSGGGGLPGFSGVAQGAWNIAKNTMSSIFETGMGYEYYKTKASTLMPEGSDLDAYTQRMFELSMETGASMEDLMEGSYNALSATAKYGDSSGDALADLMTTATKLGVAGYTDANTAAVGMMQILNATGKGQNEAGWLADIMLKSQNVGVNMDVGAQARQMASVVPTANLFGMGLEQTFANVTALTDVGMSLADATSATNRLLLDMSKSSTKAGKATDEALKNLGYSSLKEYFQAGKSLPALLRQMAEDASNGQGYEKGTESFSDLFNAFGVRAASFLATTAYDRYGSNLAYLTNGESVLEGAYANMAGTTQTSLSRIKAQFQVYADELYDALAPAVQKLLGIVTSGEFKTFMSTIINKITGFLESNKFMDFVEGLKDAAMFLLDVLTGKRSWGELFGEIGKVLQGAMSKVMDFIRDAFVGLINDLIDNVLVYIPGIGDKIQHLETSGDKRAREEKETAYQQWLTDNNIDLGLIRGNGTYFKAGKYDTLHWTDKEGLEFDQLMANIDAGIMSTAEAGAESIRGAEANAVYAERDFEAYWAEAQARAAQRETQLGVLDQYGIYDTASANRILQGGDESVISEVVAAIQALRENNPDADEWYNHSAADVYEETGSYEAALPYAQLENLLSGTTEGTEALKTAADETATGLEGASESTTTLSENTATASTEMETVNGEISALEGGASGASTQMGSLVSKEGQMNSKASTSNSLWSTLNSNIGTAVTWVGNLVSALKSATSAAGSGGGGGFAVGLDRVPYDNYPALLHKGEMVLNAAEASAYRFGGSASRGGGGIDAQALAAAMQGLSVEMDGRTVGRLVERSVSREQGTRYNRQARVG